MAFYESRASGKSSAGGAGGGTAQISMQNLPALEGTERQVAWANDIRQGMIRTWNDEIERSQNPADGEVNKIRTNAVARVEYLYTALFGEDAFESFNDETLFTNSERERISKIERKPVEIPIVRRNGTSGVMHGDMQTLESDKLRVKKINAALKKHTPEIQKAIESKKSARWWIDYSTGNL